MARSFPLEWIFTNFNIIQYNLLKNKYQIFSGCLAPLIQGIHFIPITGAPLRVDKDGNYRFSLISAVGIGFGIGSND
jgi:hypothetical protein